MSRLKDFIANNELLTWSAIFFSISFVLGIALNSIAFVLFILVGLGYTMGDLVNSKAAFNIKAANPMLLVLFAIICVRELAADNNEAFDIIQYYIGFLALPVVISLQAKRLAGQLPKILKSFLYGCLLNVGVNLVYAVYRGVISRDEGINFWYFTYDFFSEPFGIQPIYLGLFYVLAILILFNFRSAIKNTYLYYAAFLLLSLGVLLLSARMALLCLVVLAPAQLLLLRKIAIKNLLLISGILAVCFLFAIQNPVIKNRIFKVNKEGNFYSGTSLRSQIWGSAIDVSKENFIWGSGEKAADSLLVGEYKRRKLLVPVKYRYHSHNQYLHTLVQYGMVGLLAFLGALIWPIRSTLKRAGYLGLMWLILFSLSSLTEAVFTRQWGILGFAFFTSLFMLGGKTTEEA